MRDLPIGLPKLLVCTLASGDVRAYVGSSDIAMLYPVVDVSGLNRISRQVLANAAHAERLNRMQGPVRFLIPAGGVSALDAPGQPFWWPQADQALFDAISQYTETSPQRQIVYVPAHINEPRIIAQVVDAVRSVL